MYDVIMKKRQGGRLTGEEIDFFISGYVAGEIKDYQVSALLMSIFFRGLNREETAGLTLAMANSGDRADLSGIPGVKVDKHSTGGVGDKTTLVLAPLVAAAGVPVAKMSGRGLGHTGGTIDKLESIPGLNVNIAPDDFIEQVRETGLAIVAQTGNLVPADKKLYALRDVTATVDCVPLIASSVMSKKIASGADAIVLDVKAGSGAFMRDEQQAKELARAMTEIGKLTGRKTVAIITDMDQPLGCTVGNALEVREAIATLRGRGPADLVELCLALGSEMLVLGGKAATTEEAVKLLGDLLSNGAALEKFKQMVAAQGGDPGVAEDMNMLPLAAHQREIIAPAGGYIRSINAEMAGRAAMLLGAGRASKESPIDLSAGIVLNKKVGDMVEAGEPLAAMHYNSGAANDSAELIRQAYVLSKDNIKPGALIRGKIT
jgi:pyrimidine-nucleoside phosphorylase/thymidine phosphorylase